MNPKPMRPIISKEYGVPENTDNLLPWSYVETRMTAAEHYWLSTVAPDHLPHTRPIDGMWLHDGLYFGGSVQSRWRKNLLTNPNVCVNLEDGEKAVILHGVVEFLQPEEALVNAIVEASNAKYGHDQTASDYKEVLYFTPRVVWAWQLLYEDATKWVLD